MEAITQSQSKVERDGARNVVGYAAAGCGARDAVAHNHRMGIDMKLAAASPLAL